MQHLMLTLVVLLTATPGLAQQLDPNDHDSICARLADAHDWAADSAAVANCPCSVDGLQQAMPPELFDITIKWQIDPATLSRNLPEGMTIANFYDTVAPIFGQVETDCGPMR